MDIYTHQFWKTCHKCNLQFVCGALIVHNWGNTYLLWIFMPLSLMALLLKKAPACCWYSHSYVTMKRVCYVCSSSWMIKMHLIDFIISDNQQFIQKTSWKASITYFFYSLHESASNSNCPHFFAPNMCWMGQQNIDGKWHVPAKQHFMSFYCYFDWKL